MVKVSVVVPVYNCDKYINKCLESISGQTFKDLEIILVDDGSTDASGELCDAFAKKDDRVKVYHKPNGGVSSARNFGLSKASGEYVMFVDSDDYILSDGIKKAEEYLLKSVDLIFFAPTENMLKHDSEKYKEMSRFDVIENYSVWQKYFYSPWSKFFKKSIIVEHGLKFNEQMKYNEDAEFIHRYLVFCLNVCFVNDYFYKYTVRKGSLSHSMSLEKVKNMSYTLSAIESFLGKDNLYRAGEFFGAYFKNYIFILLDSDKKNYKDLFNAFKQDESLKKYLKYYMASGFKQKFLKRLYISNKFKTLNLTIKIYKLIFKIKNR